MTPDDLEKLLREARTAPAGYDTVAGIHLDDALRNLAPALLRLWRAAEDWRHAHDSAMQGAAVDAVEEALRELENHR